MSKEQANEKLRSKLNYWPVCHITEETNESAQSCDINPTFFRIFINYRYRLANNIFLIFENIFCFVYLLLPYYNCVKTINVTFLVRGNFDKVWFCITTERSCGEKLKKVGLSLSCGLLHKLTFICTFFRFEDDYFHVVFDLHSFLRVAMVLAWFQDILTQL